MRNATTLFILSGSLRRDDAGVWHTTMWGDVSEFPVLGDRLRIEAGALFYKNNPDIKIIVSGGTAKLSDAGAPTVSSVMKRELVELGVSADAIVEETMTRNTMEQIEHVRSSVIGHPSSVNNIIILSNRYHLPRIKAMLGDFLVTLLGAEDVLLQYAPERWRSIIETAEQSLRMKEIKEAEARGVAQLHSGTYKFD